MDRKQQPAELRAAMMAALARREHSVYELRQKFKGRASDGVLDTLLSQLQEERLLSDERFAQMLCRSRFERGFGPLRIARELNQHQIDSLLIEQAMEQYAHRWVDRLQTLREKKYGPTPPTDYKTWARQARFFQGRGFTSDQIQQAVPSRQGG